MQIVSMDMASEETSVRGKEQVSSGWMPIPAKRNTLTRISSRDTCTGTMAMRIFQDLDE